VKSFQPQIHVSDCHRPSLFDSGEPAEKAAQNLESAGIPGLEISIVAEKGTLERLTEEAPQPGAGTAAGMALGGAAGFIAGLPFLVVPGAGAAVVAGALLLGLAGAAVGGLVGLLIDAGIEREEAETLAEGIRRGGYVVVARAGEEHADRIRRIFDEAGAVNIDERRPQYGA
jgi:hypothetical protein